MNVKTETITINGQSITAPLGKLLIHVCRENGFEIPTLCHDDRLSPYGGCRLCVVSRSDGRGGMVAACSTPVQPEMVIETESEEVVAARRRQLQFLALNHRMECPVCERRGDCRFQDLVFRYGTPEQALPFNLVRHPRDEVSPIISRDPEKCILCGRCVRLCDEVQGVAAIGVMHRGLQAKVGTLLDRPLDCEFCGQCVNACPVGALTARPHLGRAPVHLRTAGTTTCGYCSCGCQLRCEVYDNRIERVSSEEHSAPNSGKLCAKGWLGQDVHHSPKRLTAPLVRRNGGLVETTWEEALNAAASALTTARESGRAIVGMGSPRMTTEDAYQMQYFLRNVIKTPHVGVGAAAGRNGLVDGMAPVAGQPRSTATMEDLAAADLAVVLRADPGRTHPLVKTELMQAIRSHGQRVVLAQSFSAGFGPRVTDDLRIAPGTEAALLTGLGERLLADRPGLAAKAVDTLRLEGWARGVAVYTPEVTGGITGIEATTIEDVAAAMAEADKTVFVVVCGTGIPGSEIETTRAAAALAALLELDGRRAGVLVLGEKANTQGVLDAGLDPDFLPGPRPVDDERERASVEAVWSCAPPPGLGWSAAEVVDQAAAGAVELLYLAGENPEGHWPSRNQAREMIERAGFVIVNDAFRTAAAEMADVVFPISILAERAGSFVGADGATRTLRPLLTAPGRAPQDGQIFAELARRMGSTVPEGEALSEQLWTLTTTPAKGASQTNIIPSPPPPPPPSAIEGLLLDTSPQLHHSGLMTCHSEQLSSLSPTIALRMAPGDANRLQITPGQEVFISAGDGELSLRARVDRTTPEGTVASIWDGCGEGIRDLLDTPDLPTSVRVRRTE
jgi:predicted molibdopterin-dependent oxidoreductase YjgC